MKIVWNLYSVTLSFADTKKIVGMQGDKGVQKMINRDLLQQFDEDDLYRQKIGIEHF